MLNQARWIDLVTRMSNHPPRGTIFEWLVAAYSEPHRHYHGISHIEHCLAEFDGVVELAECPDEVEFAIWCHDAFYDPRAKDNEDRSALFAREVLEGAGVAEATCNRIRDLVLATKHDESPISRDARLLIDIDLSILGQPPEVFDDYEKAIREEYSWVPVADYVTGRSRILRGFLNRPRLYFTERFEARYGIQAKVNLTKALLALEECSC